MGQLLERRLKLQNLLETVIGNENVYFQPPATLVMAYPCIVYERSYGHPSYADNKPYLKFMRWQLTIIDRDPDSNIIEGIAELPMCTFQRHFTKDGLNHDVFDLYF